MSSPFAEILRAAVDQTPGAIGGAFADRDGETVDYVTEWERADWEITTAHFGIVMHHVQSALHTFHFGEAELVLVCMRDIDIVIQSVSDGYYAMLALARPRSLALAMTSLTRASEMLRREMA
jgi:predicted regulator of Ras-like GTPase activity (Roadblock/LC7/MglB family)